MALEAPDKVAEILVSAGVPPTHLAIAKVNVHWGSEPQLATDKMVGSQSKQDRKQLSLFPHLPSQLDCPLVDCANFRCCVAFDSDQSRTQHRLQF
jgi:hypothetical protein